MNTLYLSLEEQYNAKFALLQQRATPLYQYKTLDYADKNSTLISFIQILLESWNAITLLINNNTNINSVFILLRGVINYYATVVFLFNRQNIGKDEQDFRYFFYA